MKHTDDAFRSTTMDPSHLQDEELALLTQRGEIWAFAEIVKRYRERLVRYGKRFLRNTEDAEDAVQNAFLNAYRNMAGFDSEKRLSPWLYRIAHNAFVSLIRSKKQEALPFFDPDELFPHPVAPDTANTDVERSIIRRSLDLGLQKLEPKYREPLVLRYYEELSYNEIADVLHLPLGTVSIRIKRGLAKLATIIPHDEP